ncbi:hypothetical protein OIDMADRAFT_145489 [Oidiodendron maius Zn]|uniref:Uncharacterized protein n=1 Tax=Oidiodendron maius (strain Zn) TaxID=913774 RepID=A0A0C3GZM2_OIDMZ|nr:hypothetical protein OIDMADRAFT_145489 [Oidiodendron maius Zn]
MSAPRNFRKILDVDPDSPLFHCVGVKKNGKQCGQRKFFFAQNDIFQASSLLTKMDGETLKISYLYLEELAFLTLCPRWHRKPDRSQVGLVARRWRQKIQQLERDEAEMALKPPVNRSAAQEPITMEEVKITIKEERTEKIPTSGWTPHKRSSSMLVKQIDHADPFVSSVHATVPETLFTQRLNASRNRTTSEISSHNVTSHEATTINSELGFRDDSPTLPQRFSHLPSPPDTPLNMRQRDYKKTEENERIPVLVNACEAESAWSTDTPNTSKFDRQPACNAPADETEQFSPSPAHPILQSSDLNSWLKTPESPPQSRIQREGFNISRHYNVLTKTVSFDTPLRSSITMAVPEKVSTVQDHADNDPVPEFQKESTDLTEGSAIDMIPAQSSSEADEGNNDLHSPSAPLHPGGEADVPYLSKALPRDELPQTPDKTLDEEHFGYAVITSSTRSRAYLPATQRYGLVTPPEEIDTIRAVKTDPDTPVMDNAQVANPPPSVSQRKPFMIPRKPVRPAFNPLTNKPLPPLVKDTVKEHEGGDAVQNATSSYPHPANTSNQYRTQSSDGDKAHGGCLNAIGLNRVKQAVGRKIKNVRRHREWMKVVSYVRR